MSNDTAGIFATLVEEHELISTLFDKLARAVEDERSGRTELMHVLSEVLLSHSDAEDTILYGALEVHPDTAGLVQRLRREHAAIEAAFVEIANLPRRDEDLLRNKISDLRSLVERHVEEEERELFPRARRILSEEREELLARRYRAQRQSAPTARGRPVESHDSP